MQEGRGVETAGRVGKDGFVARAGAAALLRFGTFEPRRVLRRMLVEAEAGQALSARWRSPEAETDLSESEAPGDGESEPDEEDYALGLEFDDEAEDEEHGMEPRYEIADPSVRDDLLVATNLHRWLGACPAGPLTHPSEATFEAVTALARGWASTIVHALAAAPLNLAELEARTAGDLGRERLRRYAGDMERVGLLEARRDSAGETRYAATRWLREAVAVLVAAARFETRRVPAHTAAPDELDVRAAFELVLPRVTLPAERSGSCRLGVEIGGDGPPRLTGVTIRVESGRVASIAPGLDERAGAWAIGSSAYWLDAVAEPENARVRAGGDLDLAEAVLPALHEVLFADDAYRMPRDWEPADRGAERRRAVAAAGPAEQLAFAACRVEEASTLRVELEACDAEQVQEEMAIPVPYQIHIWECDLEMLFRVAAGDPLVDRLSEELLDLWTAWYDAQDPGEPFI